MRWYNILRLEDPPLLSLYECTDMTSQENLLQDGIRAARAGQREQARDLLMQVIQADERNEAAWLWLSGVVDDPEDVRVCLQNALDINPSNEKAQKGMAWLNAHHPVAVSAPVQAATNETVALNQGLVAQGETIQLGDSQASVAVESPPARKVYTVDDIEIPSDRLPEVENPCPYCGVPTYLSETKCSNCRASLTIKSSEGRTRSWATVCLTAFAAFNLIGGILNYIGSVLRAYDITSRMNADSSILLGTILGGFLFLLLYTLYVRGLWNQKVWAYVLHLIWLGLFTIGIILSVVFFGVVSVIVYQTIPPELMSGTISVAVILIIAGLIIAAIYTVELVVTIYAWKDFFGGKVRVITDVPTRTDEEHYNMGLAYKNRGMWYIATREWEMAAAKRPSDPNYRRILGLAYAQIKQYGRALRELREASRLRVDDQQLRDDIAFVENMALKDLNSKK